MKRYERVTYRSAGTRRSRTVILRSAVDANGRLAGGEVDAFGNEVHAERPDGVKVQARHLIAEDRIIERTPLVMGDHGQLVEA